MKYFYVCAMVLGGCLLFLRAEAGDFSGCAYEKGTPMRIISYKGENWCVGYLKNTDSCGLPDAPPSSGSACDYTFVVTCPAVGKDNCPSAADCVNKKSGENQTREQILDADPNNYSSVARDALCVDVPASCNANKYVRRSSCSLSGKIPQGHPSGSQSGSVSANGSATGI